MKYYRVLECEHAVKDPMVCVTNIQEWGFYIDVFRCCQKFKEKNNIKFFVDEEYWDGTPDDFLQNTELVPVFSPRMRQAVEEAGIEGIEYIPIEVLHYNGERLEGYCIANVLNYVENAIDFDKSIFCDIERKDLYSPVLYQNKIEKYDIFLLKDKNVFKRFCSTGYSHFIVVSEKFKSIIAKNKFSGIGFSSIKTV